MIFIHENSLTNHVTLRLPILAIGSSLLKNSLQKHSPSTQNYLIASVGKVFVWMPRCLHTKSLATIQLD